MANKPLKSIKYPGLSDTYTFTQVDPTLTQSGQAAEAKVVGDEIGELKTDFDNLGEFVQGELKTVANSKTITGNVVYMHDSTAGVPLDEVIANIKYRASGYGSGNIMNVIGKNLLEMTGTTDTINGVTFTVSDGTVTANGTAIYDTSFYVNQSVRLKGGTPYILSGCPTGGSSVTYRMNIAGVYAQDTGNGSFIFTPTNDVIYDVRIIIFAGTVCNNLVFQPMLRIASENAEYAEYEEVRYITAFPEKVYGGTWDALRGVVTSTLDSSGNELAEPVEYSVTPLQIIMSGSFDAYYSLTGDLSVKYLGNVDAIVNDKINEAKEDVETELLNIAVAQSVKGVVMPLTNAAKSTLINKFLYRCSPYQNLYGYEKPWAGGTDVNQLRNTGVSHVINNVTFTVNGDGTVLVNGTASADTAFYVDTSFTFVAGNTYVISGCPSGGGNPGYRMNCSGIYNVDTGSGAEFTPSSDVTYDVRISISNGTVCNNLLFKPMIRYSSQPSAFRPWANVCPVYGKSEIVITNYKSKNLLRVTESTNTINGVTFTVNSDGTVTANGTASSTAVFYVNTQVKLRAGCVYVLNGCPDGGGADTYYMNLSGVYAVDYGNGSTNFIPENDITLDARIVIESGQTVTNKVFSPMLRYSDDYDPVFVKAAIDEYNIPLPSVLYGGQVSLTDGEVVSDYGHIQSYNGEQLPGLWLSSIDPYEPGTLPSIGADVVYRLASAVTYAITPYKQVRTRAEHNTLIANTNDTSEVDYVLDTKSYIGQMSSGNVNANYYNHESQEVTSALSVGLPILYLNGDTSKMSKDKKVNLEYIYNGIQGTCTCKWQGASSIDYSKKNYTISMSSKIVMNEDWGAQKKYVLKANYIDFSHSRNVVSAKLWGQIVKSRTNTAEQLLDLPNGGATDGFPIMLVINGEFHGLYTVIIPKGDYMFDMGEGEYEAIISAETHSLPTRFKATFTTQDLEDETSFSLEYATDEDNIDWIATSVSQAITAAINATGAGDLDTINNYIDIDSVIDHYIFACLIGATDCTDKNYLLVTYDGTKWYMSEWDLDTTFGNLWTGGGYVKDSTIPTFSSYAEEHRLMYLIYHYATARLKTRYAELRNGPMSESNLAWMFYNYCARIPLPVKDMDAKRWPLLPATYTNTLEQIVNWYRLRVQRMDAEIEAL